MNKKISLGAAIAFVLIVATATFSMTMIYANKSFNAKVNDLKEREQMYEKLSEIDREVRQAYYGTIDEIVLMDQISIGYMAGIGDKYSKYIDANTYERIARSQQGNVVGIGAVLKASPDGYLQVDTVYPDSPALTAGIEPGDLIVKLDDNDITTENNLIMLDAISGEPGTKVMITVRKGSEDLLLEVPRRAVIIPTVYSRIIADSKIGYIRIDEFSDNTSDQFNRELQKLIDGGVNTLVFDVRDNPGGSLRWAVRILDKLLPAGVIVTTVDRTGTVETVTSDANEINLPMVVLTNNNTASAAELFAQVLKESGKARIVGTVTTGKGVAQELVKLSDGSAIELTTVQMLPPSGETFNTIGIKPDYEISIDGDWRKLDENSDEQLKKAMEVVLALLKNLETNSSSSQSDSSLQESGEPTLEQSTQTNSQSVTSPSAAPSSGENSEDNQDLPALSE